MCEVWSLSIERKKKGRLAARYLAVVERPVLHDRRWVVSRTTVVGILPTMSHYVAQDQFRRAEAHFSHTEYSMLEGRSTEAV